MKKNIARATLASGLTVGLLATGVAGAFAAPAGHFKATHDEGKTLPKTSHIRVWGQTRAGTSVEAVKALEAAGAVNYETQEVFVVGGKAFADPLALTPLVDAINAPVLMTENADDASGQVIDKLKQIKPRRITVVGGPLSVSDKLLESFEKAVPGAYVDRIAGDTRFDTAALLAAYASAAYKSLGTYENLVEKREAVWSALAGERAYQRALRDLEDARAVAKRENDKYVALEDKLAALNGKIAEAAGKLKETGNTKQLKKNAEKAKELHQFAHDLYMASLEAEKFLSKTVSNESLDASTGLIKSTVADYRKLFADAQKAAQVGSDDYKRFGEYLGMLDAAQEHLGLGNDQTIEDALGVANGTTDYDAKTDSDAALNLSEDIRKVIEDRDNRKFNQPILEEMAKLKTEYDATQKELAKQAEVLADAWEVLGSAKTRVATEASNRPDPGNVELSKRELDKAIKAQIRAAGPYTVFVANAAGSEFADALVGGPAAADKGGLILLTDGASIPKATADFLKSANSQVVAVGGAASEAVKDDDLAKIIKVEKTFVGGTRFDTAAAITKYYFQQEFDKNAEDPAKSNPDLVDDSERLPENARGSATGVSTDTENPDVKVTPERKTINPGMTVKDTNLAIASGEQPADAVLAANFIAQFDGGVLLVDRNAEAPTATLHFLDNLRKNNQGTKLRVIGGQMWIKDATIGQLQNYIK